MFQDNYVHRHPDTTMAVAATQTERGVTAKLWRTQTEDTVTAKLRRKFSLSSGLSRLLGIK